MTTLKKLLLSLLILTSSIYAKGNNEIIWQVTNWPPFMIINENKIEGQYSKLLQVLEKNLPEYKHKHKNMQWSRVWHSIKYGTNVCNIFAFKNAEREKYTAFSKPFSIFLSNHIIMKKTTAKKLRINTKEAYSLNKLLNMQSIKGSLMLNRSYSAQVDKLLLDNKSNSNVERKVLNSKSSLRFLDAGRTDFILEYPSIIEDLKQSIKINEDLVYIKIKEIPTYAWGYVACSDNEWGNKLINKINKIISKKKNTSEYQEIINMMGVTNEDLKLLKEIYPSFVDAK